MDWKDKYEKILLVNNTLENKVSVLIKENEELKKKNIINTESVNLPIQIDKKLKLVSKDIKIKYKDWDCPNCKVIIYGSKDKCNKCSCPNPKIPFESKSESDLDSSNKLKLNLNFNKKVFRKDWICPNCNVLIYGSKDACKKCQFPNPNKN